MFTGLVEAVCTVKSATPGPGGRSLRLLVDLGGLAEDTQPGDSIAIDGVCLTVTALRQGIAEFDVSAETLARSTLGRLSGGAKVNAERAVRAGARLGGHFVQGHVDGTAVIKAIDRRGEFADIEFGAEQALLDLMVPKGSVAVDGISLTIVELDSSGFSVAIIPATWLGTTLADKKIGDRANIEIDVVSKIVRRQIEAILPQREKLTVEKLKALGY